jgi:hypothetical protein
MVSKEKIKEIKKVSVLAIRISKAVFPIVGKTPLLSDKMSQETLKAIEEKQTGKAKSSKKQVRDIELEMEDAIHYLPDGQVGFPAAGFKAGMIEATSFVGDKMFSKKLIKGLQISNAVDGLVPIKFKKKDYLKHNIGSNTKHTPRFHDWTCDLEIRFDSNNISETDIATLINYAGFYSGVGIWSPRCKSGGNYGMYELAKHI